MKQVFITGASRGLGKEMALALLKAGFRVVACVRPSSSPLVPVEMFRIHADLADARDIDTIQAFLHETPPDVLINNAGYCHPLLFAEDITRADLEHTWRLNVMAPFLLIQAALPGMKARHQGTIVNIGSYCGVRGVPRLSAYCASKAALRLLTQSLAKEVAAQGIKVFSVSPGGINTDMREQLFGQEDAQRQQSPAEVAATIVAAITGAIDVPNGGELVIRQGERGIKPME